MSRHKVFFTCAFLITFLVFSGQALIQIDDGELLQLMKNTPILVFFTKPSCEECDKLETTIDAVTATLRQEINCEAVKVLNSQFTRLYAPNREPALIFLRQGGVAMLVDLHEEGWDQGSLYHRLIESQDPIVKELDDKNFEHLTQASTGATTGDWLIFFYNKECVECSRLFATFEGAAAEIKHRVNLARVNTEAVGESTAKRFSVQKTPEFVFIRQGKFYKFEIKKYDVRSLVLFATKTYKNSKVQIVRPPATPFDEFVAISVEYLRSFVDTTTRIRERQPYFFMTVITLLLILLGLIFARGRSKTTTIKAHKTRRRLKEEKSK